MSDPAAGDSPRRKGSFPFQRAPSYASIPSLGSFFGTLRTGGGGHRMFSKAVSSSAASTMRKVLSDMAVLEMRLNAMLERNQGDNSVSAIVLRTLPKLMLVMVPVLIGSFPVSINWAQEQSDSIEGFSRFTPLMFGYSWSALMVLCVMLLKFGTRAARELRSVRYLAVLVPGALIGVKCILEVSAVTYINGALYLVVMKSNLLHGLWLQAILLGRVPDKVHVVSTLIVLICCASYVLSSTGGSLEGSMTGLVLTMAAAFTDAVSDFSFDLVSQYCQSFAQTPGEAMRCLVVFLFGAAAASLVAFIVLDADYLQLANGPFHGWTYHTVVGPFLTHSLRSPVFTVSIMYCGALASNLAGSLDMIVAFVLTRFLESRATELVDVTILFALLLASVNFALYGMAMEKAQRDFLKACREEIRDVRESQKLGSEWIPSAERPNDGGDQTSGRETEQDPNIEDSLAIAG